MDAKKQYEQKDGAGFLYPVKDKKSQKSPDVSGTVLYRGEVLNIAGWTQRTKAGEKYLSLRIRPEGAKTFTTSKGGHNG